MNAAVEDANIEAQVYPYCLRATAASYHAYQGVTPVLLQALMGRSDLATAQKYIRILRELQQTLFGESITGEGIG